MMRPSIEVMCIVKFQYATSAMLALPYYDHSLVSLLFLDVLNTVIVRTIPTFNFIFECFYLLVYLLGSMVHTFKGSSDIL